MTPQQRTALNNPCRLAVEVANPIFMRRTRNRSVRLTVNTGWQ